MAKDITSDGHLFDDLEDERDHELVNTLLRGSTDNFIPRKLHPDKLFLYRKISNDGRPLYYVLNQIKNSTIHYSTPDKFNDPFDCVFAKSIFYSTIKNILLMRNEQLHKNTFDYVYSQIEGFRKELKISCLTESNKDLKMWAYYAGGHSGICIEYDLYKYMLSAPKNKIKLWPVFYTDQLQRLLEKTITLYEDRIHFEFPPNILQLIALCKLKIWKDEKEWRAIERTENFKEENMPFPISCIYLGLKISDRDKRKVLNAIKGKDISCYQMEISNNEVGIRAGLENLNK